MYFHNCKEAKVKRANGTMTKMNQSPLVRRHVFSLLSTVIRILLITTALVHAAAAVSSNDLEGKEYWSSRVLEDGELKELVPDTTIKLRFPSRSTIGVDAGCTDMVGDYSIANEEQQDELEEEEEGDVKVLNVVGLSTTDTGCDLELDAQDMFVAQFLESSPRIDLKEDEDNSGHKILQLISDSVVMEFRDREAADTNKYPFVDTLWHVTGFFDKTTTSTMQVFQHGWIRFDSLGQFAYFDGCTDDQDTTGTYTVTSEQDKTISFDTFDEVLCKKTGILAEYSTSFYELFDTGTATYKIDGSALWLENSNGKGATFRADGASNDNSASSNGSQNEDPDKQAGEDGDGTSSSSSDDTTSGLKGSNTLSGSFEQKTLTMFIALGSALIW